MSSFSIFYGCNCKLKEQSCCNFKDKFYFVSMINIVAGFNHKDCWCLQYKTNVESFSSALIIGAAFSTLKTRKVIAK